MDTSQVVTLPPNYNPIEGYRMHPLKDEVDAKALELIMERFHLYHNEPQRQRLYGEDCGGIAGYVYTKGHSAEQLQIGADVGMIAFAWDDEFCDEGPTNSRPMELTDTAFTTLRTLESHQLVDKDDRYGLAMLDVLARVRRYSPPHVALQWTDKMRQWFFIEIQKAGNVARGIRPNLSDYIVTRMHTGCTPAFILNILIANGLDLGPDMFFDRRILALREMTTLIVNWASDCYSYFKETERTADGYNIIDVLCHERGCPSEEAMKTAFAMQDSMMLRYIELRDEVLQQYCDPRVVAYIDAMNDYIVGGILWCQETTRYRFIEGVTTGRSTFVASGFTDQPSEMASPDPLPIASIAWWWNVGKRAKARRHDEHQTGG